MQFGLIANDRKELFWQKLPALLEWFKNNGVSLVLSTKITGHSAYNGDPGYFPAIPEEELPNQCQMILAIGGDGTILRTVQMVGAKETPILGVNVGGLGFFTEIPLDDFTSEFAKILKGEYRVEKRFVLEARIEEDPEPLFAINEILIDKAGSVRVIQIHVEIDGIFLNSYIADGLLVSTPTGSTGYSLSSGGPIVVPSADMFIINPICPHTLTNRPIIIPANSTIKAITRTEHTKFIVAADGHEVRHKPTRTEIIIKKAPFSVNLVKPKDSNFYSLLHSKLNWGKDFRNKKRWSYDS